MKRFLKSAVLAVAVAATSLTAMPAAEARDGWRYNNYRYNNYYRHNNGDAVAAGVIGLATGAIIGGLMAQPRYAEPVYVDPPVRYYEQPVYVGRSLEPWSRGWYRYCQNRYRSFDPQSGTFTGYDGRQHFCTAY
ncbi:MAG: BA14K family protein [Mesorhizobium sp.]